MKHYKYLISDLKSLAGVLNNPENEILKEAQDNISLNVIAESLVKASDALLNAANQLENLQANSSIDLNDLEELFKLAEDAEATDDPELQKRASILDSLLATVCSDPATFKAVKLAESENIEKLRESLYEAQRNDCYKKNTEFQKKELKAAEVQKKYEQTVRQYRPNEAPLQSRTCPDHPGAQMMRIADHVFQCDLDKKVYDYAAGYSTVKGNKIPGGQVSEQTKTMENLNFEPAFMTRDHVLNGRD